VDVQNHHQGYQTALYSSVVILHTNQQGGVRMAALRARGLAAPNRLLAEDLAGFLRAQAARHT
jgi:hypothetical protein